MKPEDGTVAKGPYIRLNNWKYYGEYTDFGSRYKLNDRIVEFHNAENWIKVFDLEGNDISRKFDYEINDFLRDQRNKPVLSRIFKGKYL